MNNNIYTRTGLCCLLALPFLLAPLPKAWAAIPAEWKNTAFAYEAENKSLREVLEDFAQTFGTQVQIEGLLEGEIAGRVCDRAVEFAILDMRRCARQERRTQIRQRGF